MFLVDVFPVISMLWLFQKNQKVNFSSTPKNRLCIVTFSIENKCYF